MRLKLKNNLKQIHIHKSISSLCIDLIIFLDKMQRNHLQKSYVSDHNYDISKWGRWRDRTARE